MPKMIQNSLEFVSKIAKIDALQAPEKQKFIGKRKSGSKSRKNDQEAKTYRCGSYLGGHLGLILGYLGSLWGPCWASGDQLEPT